MAPGPAGALRGESQAARSPPPPLGQPLRLPGRGEWPGASRRSQALRSRQALCSRSRTGAPAAARRGGAGARGAQRDCSRGTSPTHQPSQSSCRGIPAASRRARIPDRPRRGRTTRRLSGARQGSVSAFSLSPALPAGSGRGPLGAVKHTPRAFVPGVPVARPLSTGLGSAGSAAFSSGRGGAAARTRARWRSRRAIASAVASGDGGREEGW